MLGSRARLAMEHPRLYAAAGAVFIVGMLAALAHSNSLKADAGQEMRDATRPVCQERLGTEACAARLKQDHDACLGWAWTPGGKYSAARKEPAVYQRCILVGAAAYRDERAASARQDRANARETREALGAP